MYKEFVNFVRDVYQTQEFIPLHAPVFNGNEKKYLNHCIDSTFVSSVGEFVNEFERRLAQYTGAKYAVVTANGTAALHMCLILANVQRNDLVITQPLSFIATCNAISYLGAQPAFVDVDMDTLGMSPSALGKFLKENTKQVDGKCIHAATGKKITACVPMHTFGFPSRIDEIAKICKEYHITLIEDAAESIGSYYKNIHTGNYGVTAALSFNGNKTITSGGGGAIITNDETLAKKAKHLTTQAKVPHAWEFVHDEIGYNYRMPNINAALALAQLEQLDAFLEQKRKLANRYKSFFNSSDVGFFSEPKESVSNYWLNAIFMKNRNERDAFLKYTNDAGVMTRPVWTLMTKLPMFENCISAPIPNANKIEDTLVNIPSSASHLI